MCFRRCQRGAAPRWRGHGHLSLVTGPASRVASLWARRHRFQGSLHTGHPLATLSGPTGRALRAASGPLLRRQLPARWPAGGGRRLAQRAPVALLPALWQGAVWKQVSLRLAGVWLPWPAGHASPAELPCA